MNFLLNKIDNDIRKKIYEKTKDGKVHRKSDIKINKDSEKQKKKFFNEYVEAEKEQAKKKQKKITINATKTENSNISLYGEKEENLNAMGYGTFLDVKK